MVDLPHILTIHKAPIGRESMRKLWGSPTHFTPQAVEIFLPNARILRKRRESGGKAVTERWEQWEKVCAFF